MSGASGPDEPAGRSLRLAFLADPASIHTRRWLAFFAERGHHVVLLVPEGEPAPAALPAAVSLLPYRGYGGRLRPRGALLARRSLRRRLRELAPDVLHAHYLPRFGWLGWLSGVHPLVVTVWGSDAFLIDRASPIVRWLARRTLAAADLVTAVSAGLGRAAVAAGAPAERVRLVQFGVDGAVFAPGPAPAALRAELGLDGRRVVFAPRAVRPIYRQEVVLEALAVLPADVALLLTTHNADPATLEALLARADRLGVRDRVRLVGELAHPAMADHYRLADVVVSVPESDAFPVTALEAMACGRPLVLADLATAHEALAEVGAAARAAIRTVPVGDAGATAGAIADLLALEPAARDAAAPALREAALARGDVRANLLRMEAYYRALAEGRPPGR